MVASLHKHRKGAPMAFGKQMGSVKAVKDSAKSGGNGRMAFIPSDKTFVVRFLHEPENWIMYSEVYDASTKKSFPVPDDPSMPGYPDADVRRTDRYLANVVDIDRDTVKAIKLPKSVVNALIVRYEKYGTLTDRDYELYRTGSGLDTEYFADPEAPSQRKLDKYDAHDLEDVLTEAYETIFGTQSSDDPQPPQELRKPPKRVREAVVEEDVIEEEDDDDLEADDSEDESLDEVDYYEYDEITALSASERRALAEFYSIDLKGVRSASDQADAIFDAQEDAF